MFSLDVEEVEEDYFKDIPNFLPPFIIELKSLPSHVKYEFLRTNETLPVIISSLLSLQQEHALLDVLFSHKSAIA